MRVFNCSSSEANPLSVWSQEPLEGPASSSLPLIRSDSVISQASGNSCTQQHKGRSVTLKEQRESHTAPNKTLINLSMISTLGWIRVVKDYSCSLRARSDLLAPE